MGTTRNLLSCEYTFSTLVKTSRPTAGERPAVGRLADGTQEPELRETVGVS
jgi:hypothetical protein